MKKKRKIRKVEKKSNFDKKNIKTKKKKKWGRITVDYCCNPQWNVCGGTVKKKSKNIILKNKEIK